ncbi:MAG: CBS domain-containing protein, partial [Ekhidna sp.]|nr:CBS domain-containing protein [Ekhidna sp.]
LRNGSSHLFTIDKQIKIGDAIQQMNGKGIDQAPVISGNVFVGSISDSKILSSLIDNPKLKDRPVAEIMDRGFQFVSSHETIEVMYSILGKDKKALLVRDDGNKVHIITQSDLLVAMMNE